MRPRHFDALILVAFSLTLARANAQIGACCLQNNDCTETTSGDCGNVSGSFQGAGTTCVDSCPAALSTKVSYTGHLKQNGLPFTGFLTARFSLWDVPVGGLRVAGPQQQDQIPVKNGLFQTTVDFGQAVFSSDARFLEVEVCTFNCGSPGSFSVLQPRQAITASPYALQTRGIVVDEEGHVGIGTPHPTADLTVGGGVHISGDVGIGTSTPDATLHLNRPLGRTAIHFESSRFDQGAPLTSNRTPGTVVPGQGQPWTGPSEARISNEVWATANFTTIVGTPDQNHAVLDLTNLGFSLPAQAEVTGIVVAVEGHSTSNCSDCELSRISFISKLLGQAESSQDRLGILSSGTDAITSTGGSTDQWGLSWNPQVINSSAFGVRLSVQLEVGNNFCVFGSCGFLACDCTGSGTAFIDAVTITVHFFDAPSTTSPVNFTMGLSESDKLFRIAATGDLSSPTMRMDSNGVGIGIDPQFNVKLAVNGIAAKPNGGSWSALSDARLKQNVQPLTGALDKLLSLRGVTFEFKPEALQTGLAAPGTHAGFLAQDVEQVFPDWVSETSNGIKLLSENGSTAMLVEGLRELRSEKDAQILELRSKIKELQTKLEQCAPPTAASP